MDDLTKQLLAALVNIIDYSASKGVFEGKDLAEIGTVRNKAVEILAEVEKEPVFLTEE